MEKTRNLIYTALCVALGIVLPITFHGIPNAGGIFLPMHIPVLLCGLVCGWQYGFVCGMMTPFLSSVMTGMPPSAILPGMLCELAVYGPVSGLILKLLHTPSPYVDIYAALIGAMLAGRIVAGIVKALIFNVGRYSLQAWITASFVTALPGIVIQIIVLPIIVIALRRARIVATPQ